MGRVVIAAFRPHEGKEAELREVIASRLPLLRELGMATDRPEILLRSQEGAIIEISEWASEDAIARAHQHPKVLVLWERFGACSDYIKLDTLAEVHEMFAVFEAIDV
ncbi:MAG: antibiotic biosynthesis monooxygenase [Phycisphaerales bacterium]